MLDSHIFRQLVLKFPHLRTHDIGSAGDGIQDGAVHVLAEDSVLLFQVSEFHLIRFLDFARNDKKYGFAFARPG